MGIQFAQKQVYRQKSRENQSRVSKKRISQNRILQLQQQIGNKRTRDLIQQGYDVTQPLQYIQRQPPIALPGPGGYSGQSTENSKTEKKSAPPKRTKPQDITIHFHAEADQTTLKSLKSAISSVVTNRGLPESAWYSLYRGIDFTFSNIQQMVKQIQVELKSEQHYIRKLTIIGHGTSGSMPDLGGMNYGSLDKENKQKIPYRSMLTKLNPLFGKGSRIRFEVCQFGQGARGRIFIQQLADMWGVPVSAQTGYVSTAGTNKASDDEGFEVVAKPGDKLESPAKIVAEQVHRFIKENKRGDTAEYVVKMLYNVHEKHKKVYKVVYALWKKGYWKDVRQKLVHWHKTRKRECKDGTCSVDSKKSLSEKIDEMDILSDPKHKDFFSVAKLQQPLGPDGEPMPDSNSSGADEGEHVEATPN